MHGGGGKRTANQGCQLSRQRDRTVEPPFVLASDAFEGKFREQIDQQLERRERLILGWVIRYRRKLKPRLQIELGLGVIAWFGEQRTIRAQRGRGDDAAHMREPPAPLTREDHAHVPQRRGRGAPPGAASAPLLAWG